jgi:hypothetical protein
VRVNPLQQNILVIDVCDLANAVMEDFENQRLPFAAKAEHHEIVANTLGNLVGRLLQQSWANGKRNGAQLVEQLPEVPLPEVPPHRTLHRTSRRFRCPIKGVFAKLNAKGVCSLCGQTHNKPSTN